MRPTGYRFVMSWPFEPTADRRELYTAAATDVANYCARHGLRLESGVYRVIEPDHALGSRSWVLHFDGRTETAIETTPAPVQECLPIEQPALDLVNQLLVAQAIGRLTGYGISLSAAGWQIHMPDDNPLAGIPSADDDEIEESAA